MPRSAWLFALILCGLPAAAPAQSAKLTPAPLIQLPGIADSNSPSHWHEGRIFVFNSDGMPIRATGSDVQNLGRIRATRFYSYAHAPLWIEATHYAGDGKLYAWYHHEVFLNCPGNPVSAPVIGALRSDDNGLTFHDLGIVLSAHGEPDCLTKNLYFGGGNGDFTVIPDREGHYLYFLYSNYSGPAKQQGIAIARLHVNDLDNPAGFVYKFHEGRWDSLGLGGAETPIFPARTGWASGATEAFWGPSVHWNTHLGRYAMVMNYTCCADNWPPSGIFISFAPDLADPTSWTKPEMLLEGGGWYPMVMGLGEGETDKLAGQQARFFMGSDSNYTIDFTW